MNYCCVKEHTLPPWSLCECGSWDVTMIWAHMICDAHHCHRCNRAWSVSEDIEFEASNLKWSHLPATGAAAYAKSLGYGTAPCPVCQPELRQDVLSQETEAQTELGEWIGSAA